MDLTTISGLSAGRRRALAGLVAGTVALVGGGSRSEARKKKTCKTCPARTCCDCTASSPAGAGCHYGAPATTQAELVAACEHACGGPTFWTGGTGSLAGESVICTSATDARPNTCVRARCPLI